MSAIEGGRTWRGVSARPARPPRPPRPARRGRGGLRPPARSVPLRRRRISTGATSADASGRNPCAIAENSATRSAHMARPWSPTSDCQGETVSRSDSPSSVVEPVGPSSKVVDRVDRCRHPGRVDNLLACVDGEIERGPGSTPGRIRDFPPQSDRPRQSGRDSMNPVSTEREVPHELRRLRWSAASERGTPLRPPQRVNSRGGCWAHEVPRGREGLGMGDMRIRSAPGGMCSGLVDERRRDRHRDRHVGVLEAQQRAGRRAERIK